MIRIPVSLRRHSIILAIFLIVFVILRLPSLFEPHWYGDEGIYASVAYNIENGKKLYIDVFDNRLPFIYYLYTLGTTENRQLVMRLFNLIAGILTIAEIYLIGKKIQLGRYVWMSVGLSVLLFGTPVWEANIANNENFFLPFTLLGIYLMLQEKRLLYLFSGLCFGIAFIVKFNPVFTFIAISYFLVVTAKNWRALIDKLFLLGIGFIFPLVVTALLLLKNGNLLEAIHFALFNNTTYVTFFNVIPLWLKCVITGVMLLAVAIAYWKKRISSTVLFLMSLLVLDYFAAWFPGRKYSHYLLQVVPSVSLALAYFFGKINSSSSSIYVKLRFISIILIAIRICSFIFYLGGGEGVNYTLGNYYKEFTLYAIGHPVDRSYLPFTFGVEDQKLAMLSHVISSYHPKSLFLYTEQSWGYDYLHIPASTFFVTSYHRFIVPGAEERIMQDLSKSQPQMIVVERKEYVFPALTQLINSQYKKAMEDEFFKYYLRIGVRF